MRIGGSGLRGLRAPGAVLDCGNSGTTTRLLAGVVAGSPFAARFEGDASLSRRPMKRIADPLTQMGARFEFDRGDGLPMTVHGADLRAVDWHTRSASAQVKSAILLAGLVSRVTVRVTETGQSRDHTERMLRSMGADVASDANQICFRPSDRLNPLELRVPGDPSSAAFFVALATLAKKGELELPGVCLNPTRTGFLDAIRQMGGDIRVKDTATSGGEELGTLVVSPAALTELRLGGNQIPSLIDELPLLACVAAAAGAAFELTGAAELRVKESDRISVVVQNLRAVGATVEELPDGLRVIPGTRDFEGTVDSRGDHRIAMAFGVLSAVSGNRITIRNPDCVAVSYPRFWDDVLRVTT
jgi:3-phosphoshikimate 1-carboxyvinyltransferase